MSVPAALVKQHAPTWAKELARRGFRTYGTVTAERRPLPDYLIIGTKRGGTTSLWKNLMLHPQVLSMFPAAENLKSPHYFDIHYQRSEKWYRSYFPTQRTHARHGSNEPGPTVVGEASPYYLFHPLAPRRVAETMPGAKLIVLLRNPTQRAYSHYQERCKEGTESLGFAAALAAEPQRLQGEVERIMADPGYYSRSHDFCSYLARGRYLEQLERWFEHFDQASVLILRSEDYYADANAVLARIHAFLGLAAQPARTSLTHLNKLPAPGIEPETRVWLDDYFRPHVAALEARLGRSFGWDL